MSLMLRETKRIWKCDNCGRTGEWSEAWRSKLVLHARSKGIPWDETITVCSDACAAEFDARKN